MNNILFTGKFISFEIHTFKLRFEIMRGYNFPYYHGAQVNSLLSGAFDRHPLGKNIIPYPIESGKVNFIKGNFYNLGISILGSEFTTTEQIRNSFSDVRVNDDGDVANVFKLVDVEEVFLTNTISAGLTNPYHLKFITPLRHARKEKETGKRFFDPSHFSPSYFLELLLNRLKELKEYIKVSAADSDTTIPICGLMDKNLMWIDMPFSKTLGGIIGQVKFNADLNDFWKETLWCGQFIHAGLNSSFGFGKYIIDNLSSPAEYISRAECILNEALLESNMNEAFQHVKNNSHLEHAEKYQEFEKSLSSNINSIITSVKTGEYVPGDLIGMMIDKSGGNKRALAVPDVKDRILQRAVVNIISPSVERLLEDTSFAYRKGLSRKTAARAIKEAKAKGMNYVLKCDIEAFFDNIDWQILFKKLDILFGTDPVLSLLKVWVRQPVVLNNLRIIRRQGLPQGSVISPLLANLYLDQFDEEIEDRFKLIRYADDVLILCRSKEEAEEAKREVEESLKELKLEVNKNKEGIFSFDDGFQYLGYLFSKSQIKEIKTGKPVFISGKNEFDEEVPLHKNNWIAHASTDKITSVDSIKLKRPVTAETIRPQTELRPRIPIYVNGYSNSVRVDGDALVITNEEEDEVGSKKIPFDQVGLILFLGMPRVTLPAVVKLKENNIPLYFAHGNGKLYLSILNEPKNYSFWIKQLKITEDETVKLNFAKNIVQAKIHNCKSTISRNNGNADLIAQLDNYKELAANADSIEALRGIEGKSSAIYFNGYAAMFSAEWKFEGRQKHPAVDPVNAMLSLGYTLLYNHIATALQAYGINPEIGFYHTPKPNHFSLASDLIEEVRFIIDRLVLYLVNRNIISLSDFSSSSENNKACWMNFESRKKYIAQFELRLNTKFSPDGMDGDVTYFQYFYFNAQKIRKMISNGQMNYTALKVK